VFIIGIQVIGDFSGKFDDENPSFAANYKTK